MAASHRRGGLARLGIAGMLAGVVAGCGNKADPVDSNTAVLAEFNQRLEDYAALRNALADSVGPLDEKMSQNEIASRASKLAAAIIAARQGAKPGDLFTPGVAAILEPMIKQEYDRRPARVIDAREDAQDELPDFTPKVNQIYPTSYPLATFPASLLPILPVLPKELEYRIVQGYLILRDMEANVIIDFMPHAVPQEKL